MILVLPFMFLIMFALKLAGVIAFSWWIVTAPIWAPAVLALGVGFVLMMVGLTVKALGG